MLSIKCDFCKSRTTSYYLVKYLPRDDSKVRIESVGFGPRVICDHCKNFAFDNSRKFEQPGTIIVLPFNEWHELRAIHDVMDS